VELALAQVRLVVALLAALQLAEQVVLRL